MAVLNETNVKYVVDSSKNLAWILDIHKWHNKHVRIVNLLIWKEPIDLAFSNWKRGQYFVDKKFSANQLGLKYLSRMLSLSIHFIAIKYKDLVKNPAKTLFEVYTKINIPYYEGKELFWKKKHHYLFGSDSVRQQINKDNPYIYVEEPWPQNFVKIVRKLEKEINDNLELQQVMKILSTFDIKNVNNYDDLNSTALKTPFWYHYQKPIRIFQRIFPQSYNVQTNK